MNLHMYVFKRSIHLSCSLAVLRSQTYSNFIASVDQLSIPVLAFSLCSNNNNLWRFFLKMIFPDFEFFVYGISWCDTLWLGVVSDCNFLGYDNSRSFWSTMFDLSFPVFRITGHDDNSWFPWEYFSIFDLFCFSNFRMLISRDFSQV